ncbi:hypothetical protein ABIB82_007634 [Bradyrhizobium sp. i1.8.4]
MSAENAVDAERVKPGNDAFDLPDEHESFGLRGIEQAPELEGRP